MLGKKPKVLILQRLIPAYRVAVFRRITQAAEFDVSLVIGNDIPGIKARNAGDLSGIRHHRLPTSTINFMGRILVRHQGLLGFLRLERPDVIICEAESHFLGYLTAIIYRLLFAPDTKLILWCFFALPGEESGRSSPLKFVKRLTRCFFSGFLSYSSFGKNYLLSMGHKEKDISVAVNVCDTDYFFKLDHDLKSSKGEAKTILGVPEKFVISYVGTLDSVKRPDMILEISRILNSDNFHFFIIGSGPLEHQLSSAVRARNIQNVTLTGRLNSELSLYYRASDLVVVPGRGGIVISEAMCFGLPVLVHRADGVEYDLVMSELTGVLMQFGEAHDFARQIKRLSGSEVLLSKMAFNAKFLIAKRFNTESMASSVFHSINRVLKNHE